MKELLIAFLSKTLNLDTESVAELLYKKSDEGKLTEEVNPEALAGLLAKDAERVAAIKPNTKEFFDNGFKKAQKEISEEWEAKLRENFGITNVEAKGDKLIKLAKTAAAADTPLEADKVKVHPLYLSLEAEAAQKLADKEKEFNDKLAEREAAQIREKLISTNKERGRKLLASLNPILPQKQEIADNQINDFLTKLEGFDYEGEGDDPIIVKDGKRLENEHGHPVRLSQKVKELAGANFEFAVQTEKGNAGNGGDGSAGKTGNGVKVPATEEEYNDLFFSASTMEERESITSAWAAKNGAE